MSHEEPQDNDMNSAEGGRKHPLPVTDVRGNDIDKMLAPEPGRRQPHGRIRR